ncbi:hypothetical protein EET67_10220 [Pseudaminobacter arsenicus]|uniref:Uncharacterized protein n=1 Tax=Borborobacter arsenicus TaxID=1851146 RepID=A0A432V761_9HYPH|nr:hypothetical protein [Pseudaminobacter arsenicus]RUM97979.1 hypothetical protein EET67_10220 [Pseudaminobacter arsenicus]
MAGWKGLVAPLAVWIGFAIQAPVVHAASDLCSQLEAQLATGQLVGGSAHVGVYDTAIAEQREQLLLARDRTAEAGCGFSMVGAGIRYCAKLNARIEHMERNLDKLLRQRDRSSARSGARSADDRLLALLAANGCDTGQANDSGNAELVEEIFGPSIENDAVAAPEKDQSAGISGDAPIRSGAGSFEIIREQPPQADRDMTSPRPSPSIIAPDTATPPKPAAQQQRPEDAIPHQPDPDRKVRVVGPTFLPDPGAAIDLQAPAPRQVR